MKFKYLIIILLAGIVWSSCNMINPAEVVPTYIHVDSFKFNGLAYTGGSSTNITTVWVYYAGNPVGAFDLPATIPIKAKGHDSLALYPAIEVDGTSGLMSIYPFYWAYNTSIDANPGKTTTVFPVTAYKPTVSYLLFPWIEQFDGTCSFFLYTVADSLRQVDSAKYAIKAIKASDNVPGYSGAPGGKIFDGTGSGLIYLDETLRSNGNPLNTKGDTAEYETQLQYTIPPGAAFIELNYNSTMPLAVGLEGSITGITTGQNYIAGVYPTGGTEWKKVYISVADFVAQYPGGTYRIWIKAALPPNQTSGFVLLDDMKLVVTVPSQ